jgi:two-component system sensor histidine kinase/response regulator
MGFDLSVALERVGGDEELLKEIADLFVAEAPQLLEAIRVAVEAGDGSALHRAAHSLKGSVANFGVEDAVKTAFQLEQMGKNNELDGAVDVFSLLKHEIETVSDALAKIV